MGSDDTDWVKDRSNGLTASELLAKFQPRKTKASNPVGLSLGLPSPARSPAHNGQRNLQRPTTPIPASDVTCRRLSASPALPTPESIQGLEQIDANATLHHKLQTAPVLDYTSSNLGSSDRPPSDNIIDLVSSPDGGDENEQYTPPSPLALKSKSNLRNERNVIDLDPSSDEDDIGHDAHGRTGNGPSLRSRKTLSLSEKARQNLAQGQVPGSVLPREPRASKSKTSSKILASDLSPTTMPDSKVATPLPRGFSKSFITHTKIFEAQNAFIFNHRRLFLALLPEDNYLSRLSAEPSISDASSLVASLAGAKQQMSPYKCLSQPTSIRGSMMPHQIHGLSWLSWLHENGSGGILGDEMGLGKTLQVLSLLQHIKDVSTLHSGISQTNVVVCPKSVVGHWCSQVAHFAPNLNIIKFVGSSVEREKAKALLRASINRKARNGCQDVKAIDLIITTYDTLIQEKTYFQRAIKLAYVILDEGHKIKNNTTALSKTLTGLRSQYRLIITGTPLQNNLAELWSLFHYLFPHVFEDSTKTTFKDAFDLTKGHVDNSLVDQAKAFLDLIMLRRTLASPQVDYQLPEKQQIALFIPLSGLQRESYLSALSRESACAAIFQGVTTDNASPEQDDFQLKTAGADAFRPPRQVNWRSLMNLVMVLREICVHPYLLEGVQPEPYELGNHIWQSSGKFAVLRKLLQYHLFEEKSKVLIFSGWTGALDLGEDLLRLLGGDGRSFRFTRIDGSTDSARRNLVMRLFQDTSSDYRVMLLSTRAGGLGITLTAASVVVFLDEDYNPQVTLQAEARAHRFGQTKPVTVYKMHAAGSVEEQMLARIDKKLYLSARINNPNADLRKDLDETIDLTGDNNDKADDSDANFTVSQLQGFVRRGTKALTYDESAVQEMLSWDFRKMLTEFQASSDGAQASGDLDTAQSNPQDEDWLRTAERVKCAMFEGRTYLKTKKEEPMVEQPIIRQDRRLNKNTTVLIDGYYVSRESLNCKNGEAVATLAGDKSGSVRKERGTRDLLQHTSDNSLNARYAQPHTMQGVCPSFRRPRTPTAGDAPRMDVANATKRRLKLAACCLDCLDWDAAKLIGEDLPSFEALGYSNEKSFYIRCPECHANANVDDSNLPRASISSTETAAAADKGVPAAQVSTAEPHESFTGTGPNDEKAAQVEMENITSLKRKFKDWTYTESPAKSLRVQES
ncbi:MAG: hypothetical protein M1828_004679 [Chrysothrix sp. TS-e1954]|nr:MAG: hypothetical protein M1828_004679 [Chrysothrix sp. TS-e1954]